MFDADARSQSSEAGGQKSEIWTSVAPSARHLCSSRRGRSPSSVRCGIFYPFQKMSLRMELIFSATHKTTYMPALAGLRSQVNLTARLMPINPAILLQNSRLARWHLTGCGRMDCMPSATDTPLNANEKSTRASRCGSTVRKPKQGKWVRKKVANFFGDFDLKSLGN
jgi:hypothetical protein